MVYAGLILLLLHSNCQANLNFINQLFLYYIIASMCDGNNSRLFICLVIIKI